MQSEFCVTWGEAEQRTSARACDLLVKCALAQPVVAVHRDYMPRSLMVTRNDRGIFDF